ncbi:hypothetical protein RUND412_008595 [Rhizina undulata]
MAGLEAGDGSGATGGTGFFGLLQKNNDVHEIQAAEEFINDEILVQRALAVFERAKAKGESTVEMEDREWQAWQRHEIMEREIEKRVAERLALVEKERKMEKEVEKRVQAALVGGSQSRSIEESGALIQPSGYVPVDTATSTSTIGTHSHRHSTPSRIREHRFLAEDTEIQPAAQQQYIPYSRNNLQSTHLTPSISPSNSRTSSPNRRSPSGYSSSPPPSSTATSLSSSISLLPGVSYYPGMHPSIPSSLSPASFSHGSSGSSSSTSLLDVEQKEMERRRRAR